MDLLKRSLAPITDGAWEEIDTQAKRVLSSLLTVRKLADLRGPYGSEFGGVSTGRMELVSGKRRGVPDHGVRKCQPLIEVRIPFELDLWELDNADRGAKDIDLSAMEEAAKQLASFEERLLYNGSPEGGIPALKDAVTQPSVGYDEDPETFLKAVAQGVTQLKASAVSGPYALVVDQPMWTYLSSSVQGRPLRHHLEYLLGGPVLMSAFAESSFLLSLRGGDLELVVGQDIAIGYQGHTNEKVQLFFTESFTYRILDPGVALFFSPR